MKQFQKLFEMDGVKLKFTKGALPGRRQGGARAASRAPAACAPSSSTRCSTSCTTSRRASGIKEVVINDDVITKREPPLIVYQKEAELA